MESLETFPGLSYYILSHSLSRIYISTLDWLTLRRPLGPQTFIDRLISSLFFLWILGWPLYISMSFTLDLKLIRQIVKGDGAARKRGERGLRPWINRQTRRLNLLHRRMWINQETWWMPMRSSIVDTEFSKLNNLLNICIIIKFQIKMKYMHILSIQYHRRWKYI